MLLSRPMNNLVLNKGGQALESSNGFLLNFRTLKMDQNFGGKFRLSISFIGLSTDDEIINDSIIYDS